MKLITSMILLLNVLQSCNNNKFEHNINTNVWELTIVDDGNYDRMQYREIEYYNLERMLFEKRYFYTEKNEVILKYLYNEKNQLIEFEYNLSKVIYFYENDLIKKKEFYSSDHTLSRYNIYEYSDSLLNFISKYDDEGNLFGKIFNYYTDNRLDHTVSTLKDQSGLLIVIGKKMYSYDDVNNTIEEELWKSLTSPPTGHLVFIHKKITVKDSENKIIYIEHRDIDNQLLSVKNYEYDSFGKMNKQVYYSNDSLRYYYTSNYSDDDKNLFIIPEISLTWD